MNPRQQPSVAPFQLRGLRLKSAAQNESLAFQGKQSCFDLGGRQLEKACERVGGDRSDCFNPPANQFANGLRALPRALGFGFRRNNLRLNFTVWINRTHKGNPFGSDEECLWRPVCVPRRILRNSSSFLKPAPALRRQTPGAFLRDERFKKLEFCLPFALSRLSIVIS